MFWVIKTRFSLGLWLHDPANEQGLHLGKATILEFAEYEEVIKYVKHELKGKMSMNQFTPNRLFQIDDCRIYAVFYNRKYVAFMEMQNTEKLIPKSHERYYRKKWRLTYDEAVALTTQLGAETGSDRTFARRNPVCGRIYRRNT